MGVPAMREVDRDEQVDWNDTIIGVEQEVEAKITINTCPTEKQKRTD